MGIYKLLAFGVDFFVGLIFGATSSVFYGLICFPFNVLSRATLITYLLKRHKKSEVNSIILAEAGIGASAYLLGSVIGMTIFFFVLSPYWHNLSSLISTNFYTNGIEIAVGMRTGILCVGANLLIYLVTVYGSVKIYRYITSNKKKH